MKKLCFISLFLIAILAMGASASLTPILVYGEVSFDGTIYAYQDIEIHSPKLDYTWNLETNRNGVYQIVFNNLFDEYQRSLSHGDIVEISVCRVENNANCMQNVTLDSNVPLQLIWDVTGASPSDGAVDVDDIVDEPPAVVVTPPVVALVCDTCSEDSTCPVDKDAGALWIVITGLICAGGGLAYGGLFIKRKEAMGKGVGLKIYTKRDGSEGVLHKHPGIVGYHEPKTRHRSVGDRHESGELTPKYEKDINNEWIYVG